jgi:hypothetical protein
MLESPTRRGFDPAALRHWSGPRPDAGHTQLLEACLGEPAEALQAWNRWVSETDFDHADGASHELAALAVQRLGAAAGSGSIAIRSRGLARRAWSLSVLALDAAGQIAGFCRSRSLRPVVIADLATHGGPARFAGQPFPVRAIDLLLPARDRRLLADWLDPGLTGVAGAAFRNRSLPIRLHALRRRDGTRAFLESSMPGIHPGLWQPEPAARLELMVVMNWRRDPPGRLRWLVELGAVMRAADDPSALSEAIVACSGRRGTTRLLREAMAVASALPGGGALLPLRHRLDQTPDPFRSHLYTLAAKFSTSALVSRWRRRVLGTGLDP